MFFCRFWCNIFIFFKAWKTNKQYPINEPIQIQTASTLPSNLKSSRYLWSKIFGITSQKLSLLIAFKHSFSIETSTSKVIRSYKRIRFSALCTVYGNNSYLMYSIKFIFCIQKILVVKGMVVKICFLHIFS